MGVKKKVLILANSVKCGCRCIAGREIVDRNGVKSFGEWIRPIGVGRDGGVTMLESRLQDGRQPAVLDVVEIEVDRQQGALAQPENWLLTPGSAWQKVDSRYTFESLAELVEYPRSLWGKGEARRNDRVPESEVPGEFAPFQSLYLIRPANVRLSSFTTTDHESGYTKTKRRVSFSYQGFTYNLPVTDPQISEQRFKQPNSIKTILSRFVPEMPSEWLMVASLARPFSGYHYKIAATILEKQ